MTRNEARLAFAESGLTYDTLSRGNLEYLRQLIDSEMKIAKLIDGTLRMRKICRLRPILGRTEAQLRCKAHYFDSREAVTFNPNGFIGFAGWADDENVQPVLAGFIAWVGTLSSAERKAVE